MTNDGENSGGENAEKPGWALVQDRLKKIASFTFDALKVVLLTVTVCFVIGGLYATSHDDGLVVEAFSIPSEVGQQGLTGQVIASRIVDRINTMKASTIRKLGPVKEAPPDTPVKVQLSDTGLSLDVAYAYARHVLSKAVYVSGEIYRLPGGPANNYRLVARVSNATWDVCEADGTDIEQSIAAVAQCIFGKYWPYGNGTYLSSKGDKERAKSVFREIIAGGKPMDRAWAHAALANEYVDTDNDAAIAEYRKAVMLAPGVAVFRSLLIDAENNAQHDEQVVLESRRFVEMARSGAFSDMPAAQIVAERLHKEAMVADTLGEYLDAANINAEKIGEEPQEGPVGTDRIESLAGAHDRSALLSETDSCDAGCKAIIDLRLEEWDRLLRDQPLPAECSQDCIRSQLPLVALAQAELGNFTAAERIFAPDTRDTDDCYQCQVMRGRIRAVEGKFDAAESWLYKATLVGPDLPQAYKEWAEVRLARGRPDSALPIVKAAILRAPHYADAIALRGEIYLRLGRFADAAAQFAQALKFAPQWRGLLAMQDCARLHRSECTSMQRPHMASTRLP